MHIGNYTHCIKEGGLVQVNKCFFKMQTMHFGNCKHSLHQREEARTAYVHCTKMLQGWIVNASKVQNDA